MPVAQHIYGVPTEDELAQLVGAATPHFALQIRARVAEYAAALPPDHPRQVELARHLERLDRLATHGEQGSVTRADLPPRASLVAPADPAPRPDATPAEAGDKATRR